MSDQEWGVCDCCNKNRALSRKYYYYSVDCDCCRGDKHFQFVSHCSECTPKEPSRVETYHDIKPDPEPTTNEE